jgi:hypothetical protein
MDLEMPVRWVGIFFGTSFTQSKFSHGGIRTVIGNVLEDRKAWTTMTTAEERIKITPAAGIE